MKARCEEWLDNKLSRLQGLESYGAERTNESIARQYGINPADILKLNYNENLFLPKEKLVTLLKEVAEECDLRIYPQDEENGLRQRISEYIHTTVDSIALGNSSDEIMDRITRIFLEKGDRAVTFTPTFSIFKYCVQYYDVAFVGVPLRNDFSLDVNAMESEFAPEAKLLYLCSPNNPTGNQFGLKEILALIERFEGIVLVDEAYVEYADYSLTPFIEKYKNLIVLRTFSKAFGLAGLRLGYAVANSKIAKAIDKLPTPYSVSVVSLSMGRKLLENTDMVQESVNALKAGRTRLINQLNEVAGVDAFNSQANFVLFKTSYPHEKIYQSLLERGIIIKKLGKLLRHENCLRSTVGLPKMNSRLLKALKACLGDAS
jgi:histidinol-phosphate aminotransferase